MILPTLLYGCSVWAGALKFKWCRKKLRSTQRIFTRFIARAFKSVSGNSLLIVTCLLPVDMKAMEITARRRVTMNGSPFAPSASEIAVEVLRETRLSLSEENSETSDVNTCKALIRKSVWMQWATEWTSGSDSASTRDFFPTPGHARFLQRSFLYHEISQLVTGHSALNHHLYKIGRATSPRCACGEDEETMLHFLFQCPRFSLERCTLQQSVSDAGIFFPPPLNVFSENPVLFKKLLKFVTNTKRLSYDSQA